MKGFILLNGEELARMKKVYFTIIILFVFILSACQESNQSESNTGVINSTDQKNGDKNLVSTEQDVNDKSNAPGSNNSNQEAGLVEENHYSSEEEAVNAIEDYYQMEQTNLDLGHGIKGFTEGAAGHQYISWNEGKWLIEINFPTDPVYAINNYENAESLAKAIVTYLEDHFLPPPDQRGKIQINGFREHPETIIQWQKGNKVYVINQKTANPLEALQIAVEQANKK